MAGTPIKNIRNHIVREAILRGLAEGQDPAEFLEPFTDKLKEMALAGDIVAMREMFDRIEGKPTQPLSGDADAPALGIRLEQVIVDPRETNKP